MSSDAHNRIMFKTSKSKKARKQADETASRIKEVAHALLKQVPQQKPKHRKTKRAGAFGAALAATFAGLWAWRKRASDDTISSNE